MARAPNEKLNKALSLYQKGYKLVDIAKELDIPQGTVRRWKKTYNWDNSERSEKENDKSERSVSKKSKENAKKKRKEKAIADEVKEVLENTELTDKQRLFCVIYAKCMNATKSYLKVYGCSYETAMVNGCNLLRNTKIKEQIDLLLGAECNKEFLKRSILQKYIDIALADITDFLEFGQEEVPVMGPFGPIIDKKTKKEITKVINVVRFKESSEIDGTLLSEVKQGKDGASIKLLDKMKAIEFLAKYSGLLDTVTKEKLEIEKQKLEIAKIKSGAYEEEEEVEDDGFIAALGNKVAEVWANEKDS
jgi:phage terminase small subunit